MTQRLSGAEPWVAAGRQGETIWLRQWGDDFWWPIVFVELDTGLLKMDVCGKTQNMHLDDCAALRINLGVPIESEDFYWQPIATAPKDGTRLEVRYPDGVVGQAVWSERPVCMLGSVNGGFPPGWATPFGGDTDSNLPIDPPELWRRPE